MTDPAPAPPPPDAPVVRVQPLGALPVRPARHPLRPWETVWPPIPKPEGAAYGFYDGKEAFATDPEGLETMARRGRVPVAVWTPETPEMAPPEAVPWLLQPLRDRLGAEARSGLLVPAVIAGMVVLSEISTEGRLTLSPTMFLLLAFSAVWVGWRLWAARKAAGLTPAGFRAEVHRAHYVRWLREQPAPYTKAILGMIAAVFVAQLLAPDASAGAAGMNNRLVAAGEWWRLGTAAFLHGGLLHAGMNGLALWLLGREMEAHGARDWLPVVFLGSAVGGNALGLLLADPARLAVGASGGVLGVVGFLLVLGMRRRARLPAGYMELLMADVGVIAVVGAVGYAFIDNAGHLGGLVTGLLLGALVVPRDGEAPWPASAGTRTMGRAAAGLCAATALWAAVLVLRAGGHLG